MSRSLMDVTPDEILIWKDKVLEDGLGWDQPDRLLIEELAFPRWLTDKCKLSFKTALPHFDAWVEGKPKGYNRRTITKETRLQHYQCEHRLVQLFERKVLERLLGYLDVTGLERHCYSPLWYISVVTDLIDPTVKWKELTQKHGDKGQYHSRV